MVAARARLGGGIAGRSKLQRGRGVSACGGAALSRAGSARGGRRRDAAARGVPAWPGPAGGEGGRLELRGG